jgi:tRNA A37 threonylcarbamoyladenosine synthetase subunit TsaC/SUA5/YrdC
VEEVLKLPEDSEERPTEPELRGQLVRYLLVEKVVRAICMAAEVEVVATSAEVEEAPILTAQEMMLELAEVDLLLQIRSTQQTLLI